MVYCINHDKPLMACHDSRETARIISGKGGLVMDKYVLERDGQLDFYKTFLPRVDPQLNIDEIISDSNDGVSRKRTLVHSIHIIFTLKSRLNLYVPLLLVCPPEMTISF